MTREEKADLFLDAFLNNARSAEAADLWADEKNRRKSRRRTAGSPGQAGSTAGSPGQAGSMIGSPSQAGDAGSAETLSDEADADFRNFDTGLWGAEKKKLSKRTVFSMAICLTGIPVLIILGITVFDDRNYLMISLICAFLCMLPFFIAFEGRRPRTREMMILAVLTALAVAGRAIFFMVPTIKPMAAICIIAGMSFGGEAGFLVGAMSMLASNMFFGQGPWTPWQMLSMGLIGLVAGLLFRKGKLHTKRLPLAVFGFIITFVIYGGIMNPATVLMESTMAYGVEISPQAFLAYYIAGVPVDLVHAVSTFVVLWIGAKPMLEKLDRMKEKYGLLE